MVSADVSVGVAGDPAACRSVAHALLELGRRCTAAAERLDAGSVPGGRWSGTAATAWSRQRGVLRSTVVDAGGRLALLGEGVMAFALTLADVERRLDAARTRAPGIGATIVGDLVQPPVTCASSTASGWPELMAEIGAAHRDLDDAHAQLGQVMARVRGDGISDGLLSSVLRLPPVGGDHWEYTAWAVGLPGAVVSLPGDRLTANLSLVATAATRSTDDAIRRAATAIDAAKPAAKHALKELGLAGDVLSVGLSGRDQWRADADDASMPDAERVGRTVVRATLEGGGSAGGAILLGGLLSPIPGGTFVGGAAGGWAGGKLGELAADHAVEHVDEALAVADAAGDALSDAGDAVSEAAAEVGDVVGDVAGSVRDSLCLWA